jgi:hypothetical protein
MEDLHRGNILKSEEAAPAHFVLSDADSAAKTVLEKKAKATATVSCKKAKREPRVRTPEGADPGVSDKRRTSISEGKI